MCMVLQNQPYTYNFEFLNFAKRLPEYHPIVLGGLHPHMAIV